MTNPKMTMAPRFMLVLVGCVMASCGQPDSSGFDQGVSPPGLPSGYALRLDRENRNPADFVAKFDNGDLQVQTGPAGILYQLDQYVDADHFAVRAQFSEMDAAIGHREGFGLFIGGQGLVGASQRYTYFLIRGDGRYLVKQRDGASTWELSEGWQLSDAIHIPATGRNDVANELAIIVDGALVRFECNGESLTELPSDDVTARGIVGVRVNHNLHVRVTGFQVEP